MATSGGWLRRWSSRVRRLGGHADDQWSRWSVEPGRACEATSLSERHRWRGAGTTARVRPPPRLVSGPTKRLRFSADLPDDSSAGDLYERTVPGPGALRARGHLELRARIALAEIAHRPIVDHV